MYDETTIDNNLIGNNINIKTGNNTDIKGANIMAQTIEDSDNNTIGGNINMDIGNNLNIESLQDTYYAKSKSSNFGLNIGGGKTASGGNSASAGFNIGKTNSTTDSQWVNEQTSIIGNNSVNIKVGTKENAEGNTNITGALIASGSYNNESGKFEDNGNLSLTTNSLTYQDLNDFYTSTTKGNGLTTNIGTSSESFFKGIAPNGTTTITLVNSGEDKKQNTRATIGNGNITIGNNTQSSDSELLAGLNRDMTKSQETTQDQITGALNGEMKIDNRIFTPDGLVSIYSDAKNLAGNTFTAVGGALSDTKLVLNTSADILGAIPLSPVWFSRKLTEKTDIPPHPFPSFGIDDEVMGQATILRDENNKPIPIDKDGNRIIYQETGNNGLKSDNNPVFKFLYMVVPGAKAATDEHDILMNKNKINSDLGLASTILPSFAATYYGIIGTILDTKNYKTNYNKIKESYNNSVPNGSIIINNETKTIKVKFNPDPNFDYKGINIIRGK